MPQLIDRTKNTITTMQKMEKYAGHLYNWYDTLTLRALHPRYISTVDSGNLAGHLLTLKQGLLLLPQEKIMSRQCLDGLADTLCIIIDYLKEKQLDGLDALKTGI